MARDTISPDATLEDVLPTLTNPEKHVANILWTMGECRKEHGNANVRIGITGEGKAPYHKVMYHVDDGTEHLFGSYFGRNKDEVYRVHEHTWSTRSMSYDDIRALIGQIRGYRPTTASSE